MPERWRFRLKGRGRLRIDQDYGCWSDAEHLIQYVVEICPVGPKPNKKKISILQLRFEPGTRGFVSDLDFGVVNQLFSETNRFSAIYAAAFR